MRDYKKSDITVIIPNLNGKELLKECLDSLRTQTFHGFSIVIVDNGSTDGSVEFIEKNYPYVNIITLNQNRGFSTAVNEGIKIAKTPYICLLNNDVELDSYFLQEMITVLETRKDIDYCAPKMLNYFNRNVLDGAGDGVTRAGAAYRLGVCEQDNDIFNNQSFVFGACAGAALYRRSFFEKTGVFDEDFFAYFEDVDINFRANLLGMKCLYVPSARVFHIGGATTKSSFNSFIVRMSTKNYFNVIIKNFPASLIIKSIPMMLLFNIYWFSLILKEKQIKAYIQGIGDVCHNFQKMLKKRKEIFMKREVPDEVLWSNILNSERDVMASLLRRRNHTNWKVWPIRLYMKIFL